ncbi:DUF4190 domain-containing protein [Microbacterium sp. STN6]|uniref:DUF4190 domain-containing protein n=1 Tax=Microbacterium sp. STN6 TaxID=2995588 RepID=UPI002260F96F|nr:DUF4190 domain-containing protein [Microbacterium sp. STN6]MCX7521262.1 DUF4190 domain-containing protein [Microbacterium sp. STN6]
MSSTTHTAYPSHPAPSYPAQGQAEASRPLSITSLVLGIVSIVAGWTFFAPIAGIVTGIMALKREPAGRAMAIWGIVLNSVMLLGFAIAIVIAAAVGLALLPFAFL